MDALKENVLEIEDDLEFPVVFSNHARKLLEDFSRVIGGISPDGLYELVGSRVLSLSRRFNNETAKHRYSVEFRVPDRDFLKLVIYYKWDLYRWPRVLDPVIVIISLQLVDSGVRSYQSPRRRRWPPWDHRSPCRRMKAL